MWPEEQRKARALWSRALNGESFSINMEFGPSETEKQIYDLRFNPVHEENGRQIGAAHILRNVTEQVRIQQALRESEERLRIAVEAADLGTWDLDLINDVAFRSLRHDQIWGYQHLQPEWGYEIAMRQVLPEDRPIVEEAHARAEKTGMLSFEARVRWPDGGIHWIAPHGRVHYNSEGRPVRIIGVVADITQNAGRLRKTSRRPTRSLSFGFGKGPRSLP